MKSITRTSFSDYENSRLLFIEDIYSSEVEERDRVIQNICEFSYNFNQESEYDTNLSNMISTTHKFTIM